MKTGIKAAFKCGVVLASVFAPFLVVLAALLVLPSGVQTLRSADALDWMWLMLLGAIMLGVYYFLMVYLTDQEEIAAEFHQLDRDHDGFITVEDCKAWPELRHSFPRFDADHDGRLSRLDFAAFEQATPAR
ncbi:MAG: EF-hand domain-containing protein [Steroidobacteraceae bacterium]